jgi:hypothetical protein
VRKSGAKPVIIDDPRPTAPPMKRPAPPAITLESTAQAAAIIRGLSWFAATNGRLGALVGGAVLCFLITLMTFGEHQSRRADVEAAMRRPSAAKEARERAQRLQNAPLRPASAEDLRKATEKEENDAY